MSFDNSSSFAHWQSSLASGSEKSSQGRASRPPPSVWGQPASHAGSRRGLTPLATSNLNANSSTSSRRTAGTSSPAPQHPATSPTNSNFPSLLTSASRTGGNRQLSSTASSTAFPPLQAGGQQQQTFSPSQPITSPRSRTITPLSQLASSTSANNFAQGGQGPGGGGGLGANIRSGTYSPSPSGANTTSPTSFGVDRSANPPLSATSASVGQSSLSKISVAQVLLLLDTISEKEGKAKWESKAEQIRKLIESNGMEVYSKFFGRLITRNAPQIFSGAKSTESGNYSILQEEIQKTLRDPAQASKIVEAIDISEGDVFKDFDLATFIHHFQLDPIAETVLANAFRSSSRVDLRTKAETCLSDLFLPLLRSLPKVRDSSRTVSEPVLAILVEAIAVNAPRKLGREQKQELDWAIKERYQDMDSELPEELASALQLLRIPEDHQTFLQRLQRLGPKVTSSQDAADDLLTSLGLDKLDEVEVANALLFMALSPNAAQFKPNNFISAIRSKARVKRLDWQKVLRGFDLPDLQIGSTSFLRLFNCLLPLSADEADFDIQELWGGTWHNPLTQMSFVKAYLSSSSDDIDPSRIPHFRPGFPIKAFENASEENKKQAEATLKSHIVSLDVWYAVFSLSMLMEASSRDRDAHEVVNYFIQNEDHLTAFMLSAPNFPTTWTDPQKAFMNTFLLVFLQKKMSNYKFVLDALFRQSPGWVFDQCYNAFVQDPMKTELLLARAEEMGWTEHFLRYWSNPLALDLACIKHREMLEFDIDRYMRDVVENQPKNDKTDVGLTLNKFLRIKADDEMRTQRKEQSQPKSVPLALKTVFALLLFLEDQIKDPDVLAPTQRVCLGAYPRLINYGEGFDEILDASCAESGNRLPEEVDKRMSDLFGRMYRGELKIRQVIEHMKQFKNSQDAEDQDLFCCIIHGLFDEYGCFHEYPLDALITTAVLFGSIINFRLVSRIPLHVGLALILEAIREFQPTELMFKFGVEALEQLRDRLPEWPGFCILLVQIPNLQGTDICQKAEDVLRERGHDPGLMGGVDFEGDGDVNGMNNANDALSMANGTYDEFMTPDAMTRAFRSLHSEPPIKGRFEDPEPAVQEKILFVINNTSNDNLTSKLKDLGEVLKEEHYQWFASYLVEQRARLEPNNQEMYVRLLEKIGDKVLAAEVLRETYVSVIKMMNAESTMTSATERGQLKNLGGWLGSLTIAKDKPIKHKNIYFTELLVEGHVTDRLPVVIPFTCKVLVQGSRSAVFKPPNPWLMEIIGLLMELYDNVVDLKLNLKFEIEVLCKDMGLDHKKVERSTILQDQTHQFEDDLTNVSGQQDPLEMFEDLSLNGINRGSRQRLSPEIIVSKLQKLASQLKYPPISSGGPNQDLVKDIIYRAFDQAIQEIISPVVERSITIASISTAQLIAKDYACEVDIEKYRSAARQMVKSLAGQLALVTCKEPLRMSITNYIRRPPNTDLPEHLMPEGAILMCVNDNLDMACSLIAETAEERSIPEIDLIIETNLEERRRWLAEEPERPFVNPNLTRWSFFIPEPYKQKPGGLNDAQHSVYDDFDSRLHGVNTNHTQNASTDSGRQLPDVLHDSLASATMPTPAEQPALPHQMSMAPEESRSATMQQPRMNGFPSNLTAPERIFSLLADIQRVARTSTEERLKDLDRTSSIFSDFRQILFTLTESTRPPPEHLARSVAEKICSSLFTDLKTQLEADALMLLLSKLCEFSDLTNRDVFRWMAGLEENLISNIPVTIGLIDQGFIELTRVDGIMWKALQQRKLPALKLLSDLLDQILFNDEPLAMRADFTASLEAMNQWLAEDPNLIAAVEINRKLKASGMPQYVAVAMTDSFRAKQDQMRYTFNEWVGLYQSPANGDRVYASFLKDLHQKQIINDQEDTANFLRMCVDICVEKFELEARTISPSFNAAYLCTDALACLVVMLVKLQGEANGAVKMRKAPYLDSLLSILVLIQNHHQVTRGVAFNQRIFFRLFSSILYEYSANELSRSSDHKEMMFVFAETLIALQPAHFPAFVYAWLTLVSHRVFVSGLLNMTDEAGWEAYRKLIGIILVYVADLLRTPRFIPIAVDLYRGVMKVLLVLHHDFPDFLCENHYFFCSKIPFQCTQIRNLILSAYPQNQELLNPLTPGFKIERLAEMKRAPVIAGDIAAPLAHDDLQSTIDAALSKGGDLDAAVDEVTQKIFQLHVDEGGSLFEPTNADVETLNSLVLYVGSDALAANGAFDPTSPHAVFVSKLIQQLKDEGRYCVINAIADQIRYPNTHTNYFCKLMLQIFGVDHVGQQDTLVREQIMRVILERLVTNRPHPWGMLILLLELQHIKGYRLWDLPFLAAAPQIRQLLQQAVSATH